MLNMPFELEHLCRELRFVFGLVTGLVRIYPFVAGYFIRLTDLNEFRLRLSAYDPGQ